MADRIGQGGTIRLDARFEDGAGILTDPTNPRIDVINPSGVEVVTDAVPTRQATGEYFYDYAVATNAPLGTWRHHWTGTVNGVSTGGDDYFTVVEGGNIDFGTVTDWVTVAEALAITGQTFTIEELTVAAEDVWVHMRWKPVYGTDLVGPDMRETMQRTAIQHAIAWQAVHRKNYPPSSALPLVMSESIGEYSVSYARAVGGDIMGDRARNTLAKSGLMRLVGSTSRYRGPLSELDD